MNEIIRVARKELDRLEKLFKKITSFLDEVPDGCLKWQKKNGKIYYYQQYIRTDEKKQNDNKSEENMALEANETSAINETSINKWARRYIKKEELSAAKKLAQKHYYLLIRPIIEKQIIELKKFIDRYPDNKIEKIYDELSVERKNLVVPICLSVNERIKQWKEESYEKTTMYSEKLKYETEQGDLVRSKSEVIIANILYHNSEDILYKYERPLKLIVNGSEKIIYPDFTIFNKHTGKITYWEHAGRMDDPYYAADFVRKMNTYVANGLLPGRDVILTFETQSNSLDIGVVKKLVKNLI